MEEKIKFIASDMDGTLLDSAKQLPQEFYDVFDSLKQSEVLFAAASGRQYYSLLSMFESVADDMIFIAENGAFVMHQGKELYSCVIPKDEVHSIIRTVRDIPNSDVVLCGKNSAYIETAESSKFEEIQNYYHRVECVEDLLEVDDEFIKIAILNYEGTEEHVYPVVAEKFGDTHQVVVSAKIWLDFMHKEASKGTAIRHLQGLFEFNFEQSMSFGDYFNDVEMLKETYHSYAMENAHPEIKNLARFTAPHQDEQGVLTVIKEKVLNQN
ncbi:HAD family hydrolase [Vibrio sp. SCSIO 43132]|uniref:Cof-type HAD-IIB family hydrolase n=1 Tax=Vibrio sp. SCSIO 43132 TaxID=2779363 RepID=UPI001CA9B532|nr:Cof-type HAD-IIB family hydrolase [Vibrio sp. SCSIO 43132]UAB72474.1 HAD family hydrolase [Vibrio sp. SCSIO 43132]